MAFHIRDIAEGNDVPILQSPALARAIYHTTEVDDEIPEKLFAAFLLFGKIFRIELTVRTVHLLYHEFGIVLEPYSPILDSLVANHVTFPCSMHRHESEKPTVKNLCIVF